MKTMMAAGLVAAVLAAFVGAVGAEPGGRHCERRTCEHRIQKERTVVCRHIVETVVGCCKCHKDGRHRVARRQHANDVIFIEVVAHPGGHWNCRCGKHRD